MLTALIEKITANLLSGVLLTAAAGGTVVGANIVTNGGVERLLPVAVVEMIDLPGGESGVPEVSTTPDDEMGDEPLPSPGASDELPAEPITLTCPAGYRVVADDDTDDVAEGSEQTIRCRVDGGPALATPLCPDGARVDKVERDSAGSVTAFRCKVGDDDEDTDEDADEDTDEGTDEDADEDTDEDTDSGDTDEDGDSGDTDEDTDSGDTDEDSDSGDTDEDSDSGDTDEDSDTDEDADSGDADEDGEDADDEE